MKAREPERILVVDDEKDIRNICQKVLLREGFEVITADNGQLGLEVFRKSEFDLVITDVVMPGSLNGPGLVEELRQRSPLVDIIVMTAFPSLESAVPVLKNGAFEYLSKPFDQATLVRTVKRCFEKRRMSRELNREKSLRRDLQSAYAQLRQTEEIKEGFMARLNHELRIPLTPVRLALELLNGDGADARTRTLCSLAQTRLNQLQDLIENLLLFGDLRDPAHMPPRQKVPLRKTLTRIVERFAPEWLDKEIDIQIEIDPSLSTISASPRLLETALRQLFLNAVRFNRKQGTVVIYATRRAALAEISFQDSGIGIADSEKSRIFDSFYQTAHYLTREVGGLGLGLALVKQIAEWHGGTVTVDSISEKGSTFHFFIPA